MATLKETLAQKIPVWREETKKLVKEHGDVSLGNVTVAMAYGGMRGIKGLICETSIVEPDKGLIIRGIPLKELVDRLPEEIFYLLCTGELPDKAALADLQADLKKRSAVPQYVWDVLKAMPKTSHPMTMFSTAILVLQNESLYAKRYAEGMKKDVYWDPTYEDSMNLLAKLPAIGAGIYRMRFDKGPLIPSDPKLDWGADYAHMMGLPNPNDEFAKLVRMYLTLHCDHESGNVSAHVCHTIGSALSDAYYAVSGAINGLAGPLHGLANQECLGFVLELYDKFGKKVPTDDQLKQFTWDTLNSGKVIPGYGHAVLRVTDPRYDAQLAFGKKYISTDPIFQIVSKLFDIVPGVLKEHGKAKSPWPNVDAASGSLVYHYGIKEFSYYTVLFGVSRALGITAQLIVNRALGAPIERPKSLSTPQIKEIIAQAVATK